jgi:hypothetical protein
MRQTAGGQIARNVDLVLRQVFNRLVIQISLPVAGKVVEMGINNWRALSYDVLHDRLFIVRGGFALDDTDRALGAGPDACAQAVAEQVANKPRLTVYKLNGSLRAVRDALPAARAFFFVDADYFPFHDLV